MSFLRGIDGSAGDDRSTPVHEQKRRPIRGAVLAVGTLACARCDAPVSPGGRTLAITDALSCPFCDHRGVVRDFLSLALPTRPARVEIRVVTETAAGARESSQSGRDSSRSR